MIFKCVFGHDKCYIYGSPNWPFGVAKRMSNLGIATYSGHRPKQSFFFTYHSGSRIRQGTTALNTCSALPELGKVFCGGKLPEMEGFVAPERSPIVHIPSCFSYFSRYHGSRAKHKACVRRWIFSRIDYSWIASCITPVQPLSNTPSQPPAFLILQTNITRHLQAILDDPAIYRYPHLAP